MSCLGSSVRGGQKGYLPVLAVRNNQLRYKLTMGTMSYGIEYISRFSLQNWSMRRVVVLKTMSVALGRLATAGMFPYGIPFGKRLIATR